MKKQKQFLYNVKSLYPLFINDTHKKIEFSQNVIAIDCKEAINKMEKSDKCKDHIIDVIEVISLGEIEVF